MIVLLSLIAFFVSAQRFDDENYQAYYYDVFASERDGISLEITPRDPSNGKDIIEVLKRGLNENHLSAYTLIQSYKQRSTPYDTLVFAYSSDGNYLKNLVPYGSREISSLKEFDRYLSHDEDENVRLFVLLDQKVYGLMAMDTENPLFTVNGYYKIFADEGYNIDQQFTLFNQYLKDNLSGLAAYDCRITRYKPHDDIPEEKSVISIEQIYVILLVGIITLMLNSTLFRMQKEISVRKLEGQSPAEIFYRLYLKWFLRFLPVGIALLVLMTAVLIRVPLSHLTRFTGILAQNTLIYYGNSVMISLLLMATISAVPVNAGVKGHNFSKYMKLVLQTIKLGILILSVEIVVSGVNSVITFAGNFFIYQKRMAHFDHMYEIVGTRMDALELQEDGQSILVVDEEAERKVTETLRNENRLFSFGNGLVMDEAGQNGIEFYIVNKDYLSQSRFDVSILDDDFYNILIPKGQLDKARLAAEQMMTLMYPENNPSETVGKIRYFEYENLVNYDIENDGQGEYLKGIVLVGNSSGLIGSGSYYTFEGDLKAAQNYLDNLQISHGEKPFYGIQSCRMTYSLRYKSYQQAHLRKIMALLLWIVLYVLLNVQILECDYAENSKQYFIEYVEDTRLGRFWKDYLWTLFVLFAVAILSRIGFKMDSYRHTAAVYLCLLIIEVVVSVLYHTKTVNTNKGGSDLWK